MKRVSSEQLKSGKATIAVNSEGNKFKVTFEDGFAKVFDKSDCPDAIKKGNWFVTLTSEGDGVLGLRPINAMTKAKFSHFVAGDDDIPVPFTKEGKFGDYLAFIALLNLGGEYKGMVQPFFLYYKFAEYDGNLVIKGSGRSTDMLQGFLEACGVWDQDIPFSDNVLPTLQKMILVEGKVFGLTIKDGWVDSIMELPDQAPEPADDFALEASEPEDGEDDDFGDEEEEDIPF